MLCLNNSMLALVLHRTGCTLSEFGTKMTYERNIERSLQTNASDDLFLLAYNVLTSRFQLEADKHRIRLDMKKREQGNG